MDDMEPHDGVSGNMSNNEVLTANRASYSGKKKRSSVQTEVTVSRKRGRPALRKVLLQFMNNNLCSK